MVAALLMMVVAIWNAPPATLGEASIREAVRRQRMAPSAVTLTNESLGPMPPPAATIPRPDAPVVSDAPVVDPAATTDAKADAKNDAKPEVKDEAWWRARITAARETLSRDRLMLDALQSRVSALANDIAGRDDPAQREQLIAARQQALDELERVRKQIHAGLLAISAIEEDARKAAVPAGWIRDEAMGR